MDRAYRNPLTFGKHSDQLGWSPRSDGVNTLVGFASWEAPAKGEGPLATCELPL